MNDKNTYKFLITIIIVLILVICILVCYMAVLNNEVENVKSSQKDLIEQEVVIEDDKIENIENIEEKNEIKEYENKTENMDNAEYENKTENTTKVENIVNNIDNEKVSKEPKKIKSRVGKYFEWDEDGEEIKLIKKDDGTYAGWEDELFVDGCGWWCTVEDAKWDVTASSTLQGKQHLNYLADNIYDSSRHNSWVEGVDGAGIGEYLELSQQYLCYEGDSDGGRLGEICVVTGYADTKKLWQENNRVKTLLMYMDNKPYAYLELKDTIQPQYFNVWEDNGYQLIPSQEINLKFEIVDVYEGTKYDDTAITFLNVEFKKGH